MQSVTIEALAKINLSLDVVGVRDDGYHLLSTVMQSVDLADKITVTVNSAKNGIQLSCGRARIPADSRNTAWRAAAWFLQAADISLGVSIDIKKNIPTAAGLAGGSSDAAAVLAALDQLCPGLLSRQQLFELAAKIGADVPFCLQGGTVLCEGIGEILTPLPAWQGIPVLLCKPSFGMSTPWVFGQYKQSSVGRHPDQLAVLDALHRNDLQALADGTANVLESVSIPARPILQEIKDRLKEAGAVLAMMSGSGPTVFGLFSDQETCWEAKNKLTKALPDDTIILVTQTCDSGRRLTP